jgi:CubicO group peptidase (beta-lactamase class C family)
MNTFSKLALVLIVSLSAGEVIAAPERIAADSPKTTVAGNQFVAPAGWSLVVQGPATILEAPEGGSFIALVDVPAKDATTADDALAVAWKTYKPDAKWALKVTSPIADKDGWTDRKGYQYETSPNEKRSVAADVRKANDVWTVAIIDVADDVGEKRGAQLGVIFGKLLPKGKTRESFAGKKANPLDAARLAELRKFVNTSLQVTGVPGVSVGVYQNGHMVMAEGFGVRELGKSAKVDADTKYLIASNTKAMTTLMLAKLVDAGKFTWETPAVSVFPEFRLGDPEVTKQVLVKHLICACTGMPRQDLEWLFEFNGLTPDKMMDVLGTMKPTSKFGELFQYSNPMAAAAGYLGGHVAYPDLEIGAAYDRAMQEMVFDPLGMKSTTFDFTKGSAGNSCTAHSTDIDGKPALAEGRTNLSIIPVRPAGGAWSTVNDVMKYAVMELNEGTLPGGKRFISKDALFARRAPQVAVGTDVTYGMGLFVDTVYGTPVVHHGGDLIGFHSDMMWLPEHGVAAVVLTNGDPGWLIRGLFRRKLLEVLFDGNPEADRQLAAGAKSYFDALTAERKHYTVPADATEAQKLSATYKNPAVGSIAVQHKGSATVFDFGEFSSEMASRKNPDGTTSFITIVPGFTGLEFVEGGKTLTLRDAQHEYVFQGASAQP